MKGKSEVTRKSKILMGIYSSSLGITLTALIIVVVLEIMMLMFTISNPPLYGNFIGIYRTFYISLLSVAVAYIALYLFVKKNVKNRFRLLNVANPICAVFFYGWSLGITYCDLTLGGAFDPAVFMTFSLTVPLAFFLFPGAYAAIVGIADACMLYLASNAPGGQGPMINLAIFFVFQIVLGISFLRLKMKLAEHIVQEEENADTDVMTGFSNRRVYEEDIRELEAHPLDDNLIYVAIDMNGLKEVNDNYGHEAGDKLIVGIAQCIEQCFGDKDALYRVGGDEFVVMSSSTKKEIESNLTRFESRMDAWSKDHGMTLAAAFGFACHADHPDQSIVDLARIADREMYASKARYYQSKDVDRRRNRSE